MNKNDMRLPIKNMDLPISKVKELGSPVAIIKHGSDMSIVDLWYNEHYFTIRKLRSAGLDGEAKVVHIRLSKDEAATLSEQIDRKIQEKK